MPELGSDDDFLLMYQRSEAKLGGQPLGIALAVRGVGRGGLGVRPVAGPAAVCRLGLKHSVSRATLCVVEEASDRGC